MTRWSKVKVRPGFQWAKVVWRGPGHLASSCSYCRSPIAEGSEPLVLTTRSGCVGAFCTECKTKWFPGETVESAVNG